MRDVDQPPASVSRVFITFAAVALVVVAGMGVALSTSLRVGDDARGVQAARDQARLIATTSVLPLLHGVRVDQHIDPDVLDELRSATGLLERDGGVLRLRVRSTDGYVVFSDDGSGFGVTPEDEVLDAAHGEVVATLTRVNSDEGDEGPRGEQAVEVYEPLGDEDGGRLGVLEVYLPYAPIKAVIEASQRRLYRELGIGLGALYVVLIGLGLTTTRRLRRHAKRNAFLAEHDVLTGLPNRRRFHREIDRLVAEAGEEPGGRMLCVAIVDVDRFKEVNDSLGHQNGDALLEALTLRLLTSASDGDVVARIGGDEFGVVLGRVDGPVDAQRRLLEVRRLLGQPILLSGIRVAPQTTVGFALAGPDGVDAQTLVQRADIAMYAAKASTDGVVRYDERDDHYDPERLAFVGELQRAIDHDELVMHLQPKVCLATGELVGLEALLRWQHPRHGLVFPDTFLPLAEQTGLIDPLTDWVIEHSLRELVASGMPDTVRLSVNVSARNLGQQDFAHRVLEVAGRVGVPTRRLCLEITETAVFSDIDRATAVLSELDDAGVAISIDDFGQGQTSLGYLSRLPLAELKIDRAFVADMLTDPAHATIVQSLVQLAHSLGMSVVAEGVEDDATLEALRELGCDEGQGYGIGRPMAPTALADWLAARTPAVQTA